MKHSPEVGDTLVLFCLRFLLSYLVQVLSIVLALSTAVSAAPRPEAIPIENSGSAATSYKCFTGQPASFPKMSSWLSFDQLWSINEKVISGSNNGKTEIVDAIKNAITTNAKENNFDPRVVLAIAIQEVCVLSFPQIFQVTDMLESLMAPPPHPAQTQVWRTAA